MQPCIPPPLPYFSKQYIFQRLRISIITKSGVCAVTRRGGGTVPPPGRVWDGMSAYIKNLISNKSINRLFLFLLFNPSYLMISRKLKSIILCG